MNLFLNIYSFIARIKCNYRVQTIKNTLKDKMCIKEHNK